MTISHKTYLLAGAACLLVSACSNNHTAGQYGHHAQGQQYGGYAQAQHGGQHGAQCQTGQYQYAQSQYYQPQSNCAQQPTYAQAGYAQNAYGQNSYDLSGASQYQYYGGSNQYGQQTPYAPQHHYGNGYANAQGQAQYPKLRRGDYRGGKFSYESLNAFEAPVAAEIFGITFEANGRLDSIGEYSIENDTDVTHRLVGRHRISALKQLSNRYTLGATWTGIAQDLDYSGDDPDYKGRIRGFIGGSWGALHGGNIQDLVYEDTRRLRGAGRNVGAGIREANLVGDGALGRLNDWGGGYRGRFGPTTITTVIDEDANYDLGVEFQRPIGNKDYRLTARHNKGTFLAADGVTEIESQAVSGVGEYVYGSTRFDVGGGYEQLEVGAQDVDRWFTSAGITHKTGVVSFTAEGQYGEIDGQNEASAFIGAKYDIARGLAATAGVDYQDRQITVAGVDIADTKDTRAILGLSYGF